MSGASSGVSVWELDSDSKRRVFLASDPEAANKANEFLCALGSVRMLASQRLTARLHPPVEEDKIAWERVLTVLRGVGVVGSILREEG